MLGGAAENVLRGPAALPGAPCLPRPSTPRALALHPLQANQAVALYQLGQDNRAIKAMR